MNNKQSSLTKEQMELIKELIKCKYEVPKVLEPTLGLPKDFTFGFEIEVAGLYLEYLKSEFSKTRFSSLGYAAKSESSITPYYNEYGGAEEPNYGGEISTPILIDVKEDWTNVAEVCEFLNKTGKVSDRCSVHINVGAHLLGDKYQNWYNFCKIIAACEPELFRFFANDNYIRKCAISGSSRNKFAMPVSRKIIEGLKKEHIEDKDIEKLLVNCGFNNGNYQDMKNKSISLLHLFSIREGDFALNKDILAQIVKENRIEFRMPNGTFDPAVMQYDLYVISKIMNLARTLTPEQNTQLDQLLNRLFPRDYNEEISIKRAVMVANVLFDNTKDRINFVLTYLKPEEKEQILLNSQKEVSFNYDKDMKSKNTSKEKIRMCIQMYMDLNTEDHNYLISRGYKSSYGVYYRMVQNSRIEMMQMQELIKRGKSKHEWEVYFKIGDIAKTDVELENLGDILIACEPEIIRYICGKAYTESTPSNLLKRKKSVERRIPEVIEKIQEKRVFEYVPKGHDDDWLNFREEIIKFGLVGDRYPISKVIDVLRDNYLQFDIRSENNLYETIQGKIHIASAISRRIKSMDDNHRKMIEELKQDRGLFSDVNCERAKKVAQLLFDTEEDRVEFLQSYLFEDEKVLLGSYER